MAIEDFWDRYSEFVWCRDGARAVRVPVVSVTYVRGAGQTIVVSQPRWLQPLLWAFPATLVAPTLDSWLLVWWNLQKT